MYPAFYYNLFPPFPRKEEVFVAMPFGKEFDHRFDNVIKRAIRNCGLEENRVDNRYISDCVLTEINDGVSQSKLIFADITTVKKEYSEKENRDIVFRNANVLYEVGLAHATRLPEEVLLFHSDKDSLLFDLANIRVNKYDPDNNVKESINELTNAIKSTLREIDLKKHVAVEKAVSSWMAQPYGNLWWLMLKMSYHIL